MRNYISYYAGLVDLLVFGNAQYTWFVAAKNKEDFLNWSDWLIESRRDQYPTATKGIRGAQKMWFRMDKEAVLFVINGLTEKGLPYGTGSLPAPAQKAQFAPDVTKWPDLGKIFVAKSPRRLKRPV